MEGNRIKQAYIEQLISEGKSVVVFENGDVIGTDSPRFPKEYQQAEKRSCTIKTCRPGKPDTYETSMEHGATYYGGERQDDGSCVIKSYICDDGTLVER